MSIKSRNTKRSTTKIITIPGQEGIRIVKIEGESKLELRNNLHMAREIFSRLVDVSVRTIAEVESKQKKVDKLQRNYIEVKRLYDSLCEVVEADSLGDWFNTPNDAFDGFKPVEVIERGEIGRLWEMFYRLRSGILE